MTILSAVTRTKHKQVEALPLVQHLITGEFNKPQYVEYLNQLYCIYAILEAKANANRLFDDMLDIERSTAILEDISELSSNPLSPATLSVSKYCEYLDNLEPSKLLAHVYVRHMGDLYGGKMIARVIPGSGKAYQFVDRPALIKVFNDKLTLDLADEANIAFDFFIEIFTEMWETIEPMR